MSQNVDLPRETGFTGLPQGSSLQLNNLRNNLHQKRCVKYQLEARAAWIDAGNTYDSFYETIDRVVVINRGKDEEVCYNLRKVAKYGVCLTNQQTPRNWGFCSKSCWATKESHEEGQKYDEARFKYFERTPNQNDIFLGNIY